jgi:hypothetical protein
MRSSAQVTIAGETGSDFAMNCYGIDKENLKLFNNWLA